MSVFSTMALRYVNRFYTVCYLVLFVVLSAVADISMDYYFGNEEPLRSVGHILVEQTECGTAATKYHCYQKCGVNHACLLGQCFCVKASESEEEEVLDEDITEEESSFEKHAGSKVFYEDEDDEQEPTLQPAYDYELKNDDEEFVDEPEALRHHIAHFCPNLEKARACISKCMKLGLPAFCGKDHVCYCGHKYPSSKTEPKVSPKMVRNQFRDLYEKYFGKRS